MDFLSALFSGQTGTDDPSRAGIAQIPLAEAQLPPPIPGPFPPPIPPPSIPPPSAPPPADDSQVSPRVLATLSNASPVQAPGGGDLPVNLIGPQSGPYAALQQVAQNAQGGSQQAATPMQPPAPQPSGASTPTSYGPLMDRILRQIDAREKSGWSDNLLRFGLAAMAAGGKPGATTLGALGEGGLSALSAQDANRGQDLKALLSGAQASNLLSEAGLRQNQLANQSNLPPIPGLGAAPASGGAAGATPSGTQGPLPPNMTKIASTLSQLGHNPAQIAGALGWATAESGAQDTNTRSLNNTGKDGQLGGSYGWQQWLAGRREDLKKFAQENNARVDDPVIQARFFDHEMRTSGSGASGRGGDTAQTAYWAAKTPEDAVVAMAHYGRGEGYSLDNPQGTVGFGKRLAAAQQLYGSIAGSSGAPAPPAGSATQNGAIVTAPQAFAMGRRLEGAGFKEEAAAWFKYADPQFNPGIAGAVAGAKKNAEVAPEIAIAAGKEHLQGQREQATAANAPREIGPTQTLFYPPGSMGANNMRGAQSQGQAPQGMSFNPDGSVQVSGSSNAVFGKEVAEAGAKDLFARRSQAVDAASSLEAARQARELLDANSGIISGAGAAWKLSAGRVLQQAGIHFADDAVKNTEAFAAARAKETAIIIKNFGSGTGLSDADREYANKAAAGNITLTEGSIRRILDLNERAARNSIAKYNADASQIDPRALPFPLTVPMAPQNPAAPNTFPAPLDERTYRALPKGTTYIHPDGSTKIKP